MSVAIPPAGTFTVDGLVPAVRTAPTGSVLSTILVTVGPTGTTAIYMPSFVVSVRVNPKLVVTTTSTSSMPNSPGS